MSIIYRIGDDKILIVNIIFQEELLLLIRIIIINIIFFINVINNSFIQRFISSHIFRAFYNNIHEGFALIRLKLLFRCNFEEYLIISKFRAEI